MWLAGLLVAVLLAGGVTVAVIGGLQQDRTIQRLTRVVQPLQVVNTNLRSGFSQCQSWYLQYELTGQPSPLSAYRTCTADLQLTLDSARQMAGRALVPLIQAQERAAHTWFDVANRAVPLKIRGSAPSLTAQAVNASVSFYAINAQAQQLIDQASRRQAQAGRSSLASELRYGAIFIGAVLIALALGLTVIVRSVVRPLAALTPTLSRLAAGDNTARTSVTRPAEIAAVASSINHLAEEGERLRDAQQEQARLRALAREAGIRIRAHLRAQEVIQEAVATLRRDLHSDLPYVQLCHGGQLGGPQTCEAGTAVDLGGRLPAAVQEWAQDLARRSFDGESRGKGQAQRIPPQVCEQLLRSGYACGIWMPLSAGGEFLGIVVCLRADPADDWRPVEIDAFEWIAADVGRGLKYAQLFEEEGRLVERFRELDQAKNDFIATVSHELRTPLTSIAGYAEMLQDGEAGPLSPPQQDMLHTIDRNTSRLRSLIEDVLTLSKVETGAFRTVMQPVALAGVISAAVEAITPETSKRQLSVTTRIGDPPLTVEGDEAQLDRVLMNVLSNAVKFTPPGGKVSVSAYRDGDFAVVEVTDSGIGIPGKDQKEIFSPFFRAANAVRTAIPGSGLGLRIVRTIVANHGGELDLRSREGQGTTVTIRLPLPPASTGTSDGKPVTISTLPAAEAGQP